MCSTCNNTHSNGVDAKGFSIHTVSAAHIANLVTSSNSLLAQLSPASAPLVASELSALGAPEQPISSFVHTTSKGNVFVTSGFAQDKSGDVVLSGTLDGLPIQMSLNIEVDGTTVVVKLQVTKPLPLGPFTWKFNLGGVTRDANGEINGVSHITPSDDIDLSGISDLSGINWWCLVKCGGLEIATTLASCVPAFFTGGPAAFVACVVAKLGGDYAKIAECVAGCL